MSESTQDADEENQRMNNEDFYHDVWDTAHKFQASYGNLMDAVDEAFQLSHQRLANGNPLDSSLEN